MTNITQALVVDDSKSARYSLKKILQKQGIESFFAESAGDALNILERKTPDVIFMDHLMPGMDGFEATRAIKSNPDTRNIPVIMCTSRDGITYEDEARANGAVAILPKPAPEQALSGLLETLKSQPPEDHCAGLAVAGMSPSIEAQVEEIINNCRPVLLDSLQSSIDERIQHSHTALGKQLDDDMQKGILNAEQQLNTFAGELMQQHLGKLKQELTTTLTSQLGQWLEKQLKSQLQEELTGKSSYDRGHPLFERINRQLQGSISHLLSRDINSILARHEQQLIDSCRREIAAESARSQTLSIAAIAIGMTALAFSLLL